MMPEQYAPQRKVLFPFARQRGNVTDAEWQEILDKRHLLHRRGYLVIPCSESHKGPLFKAWPSFRYDPDNPEPPFPRTTNAKGDPTAIAHVGTGALTTGLIAVDVDVDDARLAQMAREAFEDVAGQTPLVRTRPNSPRKMLIYAAPMILPPLTLRAEGQDKNNGRPVVELDANHGGQFVMLDGMHPSGAILEYEDAEPWEIYRADLPAIDELTIYEALSEAAIVMGGKPVQRGYAPASNYIPRESDDMAASIESLLDARSITPAAQHIAECFAVNFGPQWQEVDGLLLGLARIGRARHPNQAPRYDNLIQQVIHQSPTMGQRICQITNNLANEKARKNEGN